MRVGGERERERGYEKDKREGERVGIRGEGGEEREGRRSR